MKHFNDGDFASRRKSADEARSKLLDSLKRAPKPTDPEVVARREERLAMAAAREARQTEKNRLKQEAAERQAAQAAAEALAKAEALKAEIKASSERAAIEEAAQKAERDRRYAARKTRKR